MPNEMKPLPFDPKKIAGFSETIFVSHYENNYVGAVKRLNAIGSELLQLDWPATPNFTINGLKREELIAANSMLLHELYFDGFAGEDRSPKGKLAGATNRDFGSLDRWRASLSAMGKAQGGGSGWVILAYSGRMKRLLNIWAGDHAHMLAGVAPLIALDMYEHAYHMDFGANAGAYVDAFMSVMLWDDASAKYEA